MVPLQGKRIGIQEHGEPSPQLYEGLRERGADVLAARVYHWELPEDTGPLRSAIRSLVAGEFDLVMFTSSVQFVHAARIAAEMAIGDEFINALRRTVVASIGPIASETLRSHGVEVDFEPSHPKMGFLVKEAAENIAALLEKKSAAKAAGSHPTKSA